MVRRVIASDNADTLGSTLSVNRKVILWWSVGHVIGRVYSSWVNAADVVIVDSTMYAVFLLVDARDNMFLVFKRSVLPWMISVGYPCIRLLDD